MASPFPGMDPYLDHPDLWSDVHHRLITVLADTIDYTRDAVPPLEGEDAIWAAQLLREAGVR